MWPQWTSMLSPLQWAVFAAIPLAIIALYFLKLKRTPLEVPSTYLWHKSIEDLHVNSIWQRLRSSLLLFLQLLLLLIAALALLRPAWSGTQLTGERFIYLIDTSASMAATDVSPTRLDAAKVEVMRLISQMKSGDVAMVVTFGDRTPSVVQSYTDNRPRLAEAVNKIQPTIGSSRLDEALRVVAGLANPGRAAFDIEDDQVAEAMPATLYLFSDGNFPPVEDFSLGNLSPVFRQVGTPDAKNLAITMLSTRRHEVRENELEAFARIENFSTEDRVLDVELYVDGELSDADRVEIAAADSRTINFRLGEVDRAVLEMRIRGDDALSLDDRAYSIVQPPQPAQILLISPGDNTPLRHALSTERALRLAATVEESIDYLGTPEYESLTASGELDWIIYDRCAPEVLPPANTLFIDALPPGESWRAGEPVDVPQILDTERAHPLMQLVNMGDVLVARGRALLPPPGHTSLIHTSAGAMFAIAPRQRFEDAVLGFAIYDSEHVTTNWPSRASFPVFILNLLDYAARNRLGLGGDANLRPGAVVSLKGGGSPISITPPGGTRQAVERGTGGEFEFSATDELGIYEVQEEDEVIARFSVNLFNAHESAVAVDTENPIRIGPENIAAQTTPHVARREVWKLLLLLALVVLLFEWYIYNRRVYI